MRIVLLGEAPKRADGFAFDALSWTTQQLAAVLNVDPFHLNRVFWVMNVFEAPQRRASKGFDKFSVGDAAEEIRQIYFEYQRVICLGRRVAGAMELAFGLPNESIPENKFQRFDRTARGSGWELARIPHPSGLRENQDVHLEGFVLPPASRAFLYEAAFGSGAIRPRGRRRQR